MESYHNEPCSLSSFIHFCTVCKEIRRTEKGWEATNRRRRFIAHASSYANYQILNVTLDAHDIVFYLIEEKSGKEERKAYSLYEVGWCFDTYGGMTFLHRDGKGKETTFFIS